MPEPIETLLELVNQVMRLCTQTTARSEALESLLIDKGLLTREELEAKIEEHAIQTKKLADALGSSGGMS